MSKLNQLNLEKSDEEIHSAYERFAAKWQDKAQQAVRGDQIARF